MIGGQTPRAILLKMQEDVTELSDALDEVHGNAVNIMPLQAALHGVMNELDIAVQRAGRV